MKRTVSLDSNIFVAKRFDYENAVFAKLAERVNQGRVGVVLTSVVVGECHSNIEQMVGEACDRINKAQKEASMLRMDPACASVLAPIDRDQRINDAKARFDTFVRDTLKADIESVEGINAADVFDDYFLRRPPFASGKKKSEFPDSFSVKSLKAWSDRTSTKLAVASDDAGYRDACSACGITPFSRLEEFLEEVAQIEQKVLAPLHEQLVEKSEALADVASDAFTNLGFILEDEDGEVHDVAVDSIEFDEWSVLDVDEDSGIATCLAGVAVSFRADIEYDDMDTASWDSEDKRYYVHHRITASVESTKELTAKAKVYFDPEDPSGLDVLSVTFEGDRDVWVTARRSDH